MKELFVVAGEHSLPGQEAELDLRRRIDVQNDLILDLALERQCTGYFFDGKSGSGVRNLNAIVEYLATIISRVNDADGVLDYFRNRPGRVSAQGIRQFLHDFQHYQLGSLEVGAHMEETLRLLPEGISDYILFSQYRQLGIVRSLGLNIEFLPTEDSAFDQLSFLRGKIPWSQWSALAEAQKSRSAEEFTLELYADRQRADLLVAKRDKHIHRNVSLYGHSANVLFIGKSHLLADLERDPRIMMYRLDVSADDRDRIQVQGELPRDTGKIILGEYSSRLGVEMNVELVEERRTRVVVGERGG